MNLANALTLSRIFLVPLMVVVLLTRFEGHRVMGVPKELIGAGIFAVASLTDWLDGYVARRRKQVTAFGQFTDPLADKLLTIAAFISLVQMELVPAWIAALLIGRDFAVTALRSRAYARGVSMPASKLGKVKMGAQVVAILALILGREWLREFVVVGQVALWVAVATALVSAADYFRQFNRIAATPRRPAGRNDARKAG